jgi:SAM-dependent methyltransferase
MCRWRRVWSLHTDFLGAFGQEQQGTGKEAHRANEGTQIRSLGVMQLVLSSGTRARRLPHSSIPYSLKSMAPYDLLAAHYDAVTGDSATETTFIDGIIKHVCSEPVTLLEVACGTGGIIAPLAARYQVSGLDISPGMLAVAREKLPEGTALYVADMSRFELNVTFDAIVCVYHGINHLLDFSDWESFFDCAYRHLNYGGVLIFDIITVHSLKMMAGIQQTVQQFGDNYLLIRVRPSGKVLFDWDINVFELQPGGRYILLKEVIRTASFPCDVIRKALGERFSSVSTIDSGGSVVDEDNEHRTWFVCTKPERPESV